MNSQNRPVAILNVLEHRAYEYKIISKQGFKNFRKITKNIRKLCVWVSQKEQNVVSE